LEKFFENFRQKITNGGFLKHPVVGIKNFNQHQSTNWIERFVLIAAIAELTSSKNCA
jgi:hypothetical protein